MGTLDTVEYHRQSSLSWKQWIMLVLSVLFAFLLRLDWPGAERTEISVLFSAPQHFIFNELFYSLPVIACLIAAIFLSYLGRAGNSNCAATRWRAAMWICCLPSGLGPLYTVNRVMSYRLGVYGFFLPFVVVMVMLALYRKGKISNDEPAFWNRMFAEFLKLFFGTVSLTLALRLILYVVKL